jgi:hypothetical protein
MRDRLDTVDARPAAGESSRDVKAKNSSRRKLA